MRTVTSLMLLLAPIAVIGVQSSFDVRKTPLTLNYQNFTYNQSDDTTAIGINYKGDCKLHISYYRKFNILNGEYRVENSRVLPNNLVVMLAEDENDPTYFRVVAKDETGVCSDVVSEETFYKLERNGLASWHFKPFSTVKLPIPRAGHCVQLLLVWPKYINSARVQCHCMLTTDYRLFEVCANSCETEYDVEISDSSVIFHNVSPEVKNALVHFVCEEQPCTQQPSCYLVSIVASYQISSEDAAKSNESTKCATDKILVIESAAPPSAVALFLFLIVGILICLVCKKGSGHAKFT